ncbi:nitrous oxide reductase family maturation protein NosD [Dechloromonas hortensis]|uniref:nitrous oxide reductase family maturation protein NosD n=1 Tax=Dechloromonas hortensis TaxID=337779 RepID=UPI001292AF9E|nr:nitrous oxide reductase family maturation protein NosD [Dechloromonas hortensis]
MSKRSLVIRAGLTTALLLACQIGNSVQQRDDNADMGGKPRVDIDRPKPTYMLHERDKRVHGLRPFQDLVDKAPAGSVLKPPPGVYAGPVVINKPLIIEGGGQVTIDAGDKGTVMALNANNSVLRGLHLTGSGDSHDTDDSCLDVRGHNNVIEDLKLDNCLFGFDFKQSNNNLIRGNTVRSKDRELGVRGDGLRLWYSHDNIVEKNQIIDSRDMVAWYSNKNVFRDNLGRRSRYSIHFMFANDNIVERNQFYDNAVGVYFMYTEGGAVRNNVISHATGATGMGIGFKEASGTVIENNEIIYCGIGIGSDLSPFQPESTIEIRGNRFAYNGIGILFNSETGGNNMVDNIFEGNLTQVTYGGRGDNNNNPRNFWQGNYWDDFQGFDRNGDGIGDQKHDLYAYADQIWMEMPVARFFRSSPVMELLDFLERLAPFSSPDLILRDEQPRFIKPARAALS